MIKRVNGGFALYTKNGKKRLSRRFLTKVGANKYLTSKRRKYGR